MSGISCLLGTPEAQAKIRAWYQTQLAKPVPWDGRTIDPGEEILAPAAVDFVEEAPAAVEEDAPAVEEAPVYKATADVHPRDGVMLVKGKALLALAEHKEYGKMTSHQILVVLTKKFKQGKGEKSQKQIMVESGMFQDADFKIATFVDLEMEEELTVLTYTWNDSPAREQYGPLYRKMEAQGIDMFVKWFWIDIFCLDQQHPDKMETIKRSNEIYALAKYYLSLIHI